MRYILHISRYRASRIDRIFKMVGFSTFDLYVKIERSKGFFHCKTNGWDRFRRLNCIKNNYQKIFPLLEIFKKISYLATLIKKKCSRYTFGVPADYNSRNQKLTINTKKLLEDHL